MLAPLLRLVTGVQDRWEGIDPLGAGGEVLQRIYFANHASHLDAPVIWAALPPVLRARTRPVAARDYWDCGPIRRFLSRDILRVVFIERNTQAPRGRALWPIEEALRAGDSLILFPEGTRNQRPDEGLLPFRSGLYHIAERFPGVQIVPTWLENASRILPKGEFAPVPLIVRVTFGAPIVLQAGEDKEAFLARAAAALRALSPSEGR